LAICVTIKRASITTLGLCADLLAGCKQHWPLFRARAPHFACQVVVGRGRIGCCGCRVPDKPEEKRSKRPIGTDVGTRGVEGVDDSTDG
jgi:hypothetical protein